MKTALRWVRRLLDVALILLVVSVLGLVLAVNLGPRFGHQLIVIRGGSMEPAIHLGSATEISSVQSADLRPGDVVTLKEASGTLVSHRITRIVQQSDGLYVETKGDANSSVDPVLTPVSSVIGRVDFSIPELGYLIYLLTVPIGVISVLSLALTLLFAVWLLEDIEREPEPEVVVTDAVPYESDLARMLFERQMHDSIGQP
jgi:signal peptidase I